MARAKKQPKVEVVREVKVNDFLTIVIYSDGTAEIKTKVQASEDELLSAFGVKSEDEEEDDEEEDEEDDEEEDDEEEEDEEEDDEEEEDEEDELTGESLAEMDFEELEDVCDDKDLDVDPDDFDEDEIEKLRKAIAKELKITLPKAKASKKEVKGKKGKK